MKKIYCFIGLPASGKGTQAEMFADSRGLIRIGIGDLVREEMETNKGNDDFINTIRKLYSEGKPVTDDIVFELLEKKIKKIDGDVVFDNFPFNKGQTEFLEKYTKSNNFDPVIIYIKIDPESAVKRIASRRVCPKCKAVYFKDGICEKCGTKLVARSDDNEETVRTRIQNYMPNIEFVVKEFKKNGTVYEIDGEPSIEGVKKQVSEIE